MVARLESWRERAACLGMPDVVFFPDQGVSASMARSVCATCRVADECLMWAVRTGQEHGVFGGKTARERTVLARQWGLI